jgi:hypothetical protein
MLKLIVPLVCLTSLAGCASNDSKEVAGYDHPYCYTDETIEVEDGTRVKSRTRVQCTDKPRIEHVVKEQGVASNCRISRPLGMHSSNAKYGETLLCKFTDPMGRKVWRPVNEAFAYPNFN